MKHIKALGCGISRYACIGLSLYLLTFTISKHSINYDNVALPATVSTSDSVANNFYAIPSLILGVVNNVPYVDIGDVVDSSLGRCRPSYSVFSLSGLIDYFSVLLPGVFSAYRYKLALYGPGVTEHPGILMPVAALSTFNPTPALALPSWTVLQSKSIINANVIGSQRTAKAAIGANDLSPCILGFVITALFVGYSGALPPGYAQMPRGSTPQIKITGITEGTLNVSGRSVNVAAYLGGITSLLDIPVYVKIHYDFTNNLYVSDGFVFQAPTAQSKFLSYAYIGTVTPYCYTDSDGTTLRTYLCALRISQPQCSPIYVQDTVMGSALPSDNDDATVYVYTYKSSSNQMLWMAVKDC